MIRRGDNLLKILWRFGRHQGGTTAVIFGLAFIPLMIATGAAIDYSRAYRIQSRLQSAVDAAALAAASAGNLEIGERISLGQRVFDANFPASVMGTDVDPQINIVDNVIDITAAVDVPTVIMDIVGHHKMGVDAVGQVLAPTLDGAEIVLVLDYSSSMNTKGKYQAMRDAAIALVDDVTKSIAADKVKFGLVPFAGQVYTSLPGEYAVDGTAGSIWTNCTADRKYPYNTQDNTPDPGNDDTKWGYKDPTQYKKCNNYVDHKLTILPLTLDHSAVKTQLQEMTPYVMTHIALGLEFGWHLISPNLPYDQGVAYNTEGTLKAIVLLTDGRQTAGTNGPGGTNNATNGETNLETMCTAIKDDGVLLITVAFDLQDPLTADRLRDCATSVDNFFDADDNAELASAFSSITGQLVEAVHISK